MLSEVDVYVGMELSVVPVYQSEIVPTSVRGLVVGTYQFSLIVRSSFPPEGITFTNNLFLS